MTTIGSTLTFTLLSRHRDWGVSVGAARSSRSPYMESKMKHSRMTVFQSISPVGRFLLPAAACLMWGCPAAGPASDGGVAADASVPADGGGTGNPDAGTTPADAGTSVDGGHADAGTHADGGQVGPAPVCSDAVSRAWDVSTLQSEGGFKPRADITFAADGRLRAVYSAAQSEDGWGAYGIVYEEEKPDGLFESRVVAEPIFIDGMPPSVIDNEYPTLVVDNNGTSHIVYSRYVLETEQIDVFMTSGTLADGFSEPKNLTESNEDDEFGASIAIDGENRVHVLFLRRRPRPEEPTRFDYSVGYLQVVEGEPGASEEVASGARVFEGNPEQAIALGADASVHTLFRMQADGAADGKLVYRKRSAITSEWDEAVDVTDDASSASDGAIAVSSDGDVYTVFALGRSEQTMHFRRFHEGAWGEVTALSSATTDKGSYLGLAADTGGAVHVAYRRGYGTQADVIYHRIANGVADAEVRLTETTERDEQLVAIDVSACGEIAIVHPDNFQFLPDGVVYVSRYR